MSIIRPMDNIYTKMYTDKFRENNIESFKVLDDFTLNRKTEIRYMVCAIELGVHITNDELTTAAWSYNNFYTNLCLLMKWSPFFTYSNRHLSTQSFICVIGLLFPFI